MKKTLLVMRQEIRATLARKGFLILAFGTPLILGIIALVVAAINQDAPIEKETIDEIKEVHEGYVDEGGLIKVLPPGVPPDWLTVYPDETTALNALEAEEITAYFLIHSDYVESGEITYTTMQYNPISDNTNTSGIEQILLFNLLGDVELAVNVLKPIDVQERALETSELALDEDNWIVELFPTMMVLILYMVILMPAGLLVNAVTDEKKNRIMEVLFSSLTSSQLIGGKILALGLLGLIQTSLYVGILWAVVRFGGQQLSIPAGFSVPTQIIVWSLVYGLLGYAMYGAQLAGLGALAPDIKDARGASIVIMSPLILVYMLNIVIITAPDGLLAVVLSLFPLTSPVGMIARMTQVTVPVWQTVLAVVLQVATAILIVRLVSRLFRAQVMLSGQPFSARRFLRALKE